MTTGTEPTLSEPFTDAQRLDWLEKAALKPGGILLHDGSQVGRTGLGIWPTTRTKRTLRDAIDGCLRYPNDF